MQTQKTLSIHEPYHGKFTSANGHVIDIHCPSLSNIEIEDIAIGLSNTCRFGGQLKDWYSVAQHSVFVMYLAPDELKKEALMHDAAEAYLGDVIKPLKLILGDVYDKLEASFMKDISYRFGLSPEKLMRVKEFDIQALELENEALKNGHRMNMMVTMNKIGMMEDRSHFLWPSLASRHVFLDEFHKLWK